MFPVLDYDGLPTTKWSTGNEVVGSNAQFDSGWLRWDGWDNSGRPEGGTMLYSVGACLRASMRTSQSPARSWRPSSAA